MTRKERVQRQLDYHNKIDNELAQLKGRERLVYIRHKVCTDIYFLLYYVLGRTDICYEEWIKGDRININGVALDYLKKAYGEDFKYVKEGNSILVDKGLGDVEYEKNGKIIERYYRPFLFERCQEIQANPDGYLDIYSRDHYKDIADDTPLWTFNGWKTQGTVEVGDYVITPNGLSKVIAVRHFKDSHCKKINFNHNVEPIVCGNGHLWKVNQYNFKKKDKKKIGWEENIVETNDVIKNSKHPYISIPSAYEGSDIPLPISPYVLGVWLGDGCKSTGRITNQNDEIWDMIVSEGYTISKNMTKKNTQFRTIYDMVEGLRFLDLIYNKHIPELYLAAKKEDRYELLRGLMDTDGSCGKDFRRNGCCFVNQNKRLVDDFRALCMSLGIKTSVCVQTTNFNTTAYYVRLSIRNEHDRIFNLKRKASRVKKTFENQKQSGNFYINSIEEHETVPTTCIQIEDPDGMYYVGHDMIQTHNSTIITYALTMQEILKNPEITICIYSYNVSTAEKMVEQIKNDLQSNSTLLACFPDILFKNTNATTWEDSKGNKHKMVWASDMFNVKRKTNPKEHTMECSGLVTGQKTGGHYNLLIYDDTVTPESVFTPNQIDKTTSQFKMSINTGSTANMRIRMIGTRYAEDDTYSIVMKEGIAKPRIYKCTEDGSDDVSKSVLYTPVILADKLSKMSGYVAASQMFCDPKISSSFHFDPKWIKDRVNYQDIKLNDYNWYIIVDPATKVSKDADFTVMWVIGTTLDRNYLCAELIRDKLQLSEKKEKLFNLVNKYTNQNGTPTVFYENVSMQADVQYMEEQKKAAGLNFTIIPASGKPRLTYGTTGQNQKGYKDLRIQALEPMFRSGRILFVHESIQTNWKGEQEDTISSFFNEEYTKYPLTHHDDGLDALSRIADLETGPLMLFPEVKIVKERKRKEEYDPLNFDNFNPYNDGTYCPY